VDEDDPRVLRSRGGARARRDDDEEDDYVDDRDDYEDEDELPRSRRSKRRSADRPGKVQAIAIMTLVGGIYALIHALMWLIADVSSCGIACLWPGQYYSMVVGILATIKGSQLLGAEGHLQPAPRGTAIMMIINVINGDVVNCVLGILVLVFCSDPEAESYYQGA
jgi:hypothetical protein